MMELLNYAKKKIIEIDIAIVFAQAQANYWSAFATSKANRSRTVYRGDSLLTELELEKEAFETAQKHIHRIQELGEAKIDLLSDKNNYFK